MRWMFIRVMACMLMAAPPTALARSSVAVVDFTVPDGDAWSWATKGLPDLLEIELQSYELNVVDRALIGALLSDKRAYAYLPKSVAYLPEPAEMMESLRSAGFSDATRTLLSGGITQMLTGTRDLR